MSEQQKVYVIHENAEWLPPLRAAFEDLGTPYEEWLLDQTTCDLRTVPPTGVFYSRMSASNYTRGHAHSNYSTDIILRWLEAHGRRVINGSSVLQLELSKATQQILLDHSGFSTPRTVVAVGRDKCVDAALELGITPFILKPAQGGKGLGVTLYDTVDALSKAIDANALPVTVDDVWLVQEKIETNDDFITRMEFVGGKLLYALRIYSGGSFELCPADVCETDLQGFCPANSNTRATDERAPGPRFEVQRDHDEVLARRLEGFLEQHGIEIAGVEFIRRPDGTPVIYDINTNTNYNSAAENAAKIDVGGMAHIAGFLSAELDASLQLPPARAMA